MPSFDIVSELNLGEVDNAVQQAAKELTQRYDFKGSNTSVVREELVVTIESADDYKVTAALDVLQSKFAKRNVSLKAMKIHPVEPASSGRARQKIDLLHGIDSEKAKAIVKRIKDSKLKVQASIQGPQVRVSGKKRDLLQETIALVKGADFELPLQFTNFRE